MNNQKSATPEPIMDENELKQLKAYKVGYDLGWYRAVEAISSDLQEIVDGILNSATIKRIERENHKKPMFLAKILDIITSLSEMKQEALPTLVVERKAITKLGEGLMEAMAKNPSAFDGIGNKGDDKLLGEVNEEGV